MIGAYNYASVYWSTKTEQRLTNKVLSNGKKHVTKNQNILIKMVGRKCVLESHSSSLRQPNKYVCGVVMKLGNSFLCVFQILKKHPQIYCLCHNRTAKG